MPDTFEILADPTRRRILDELRDGDRVVGQLVGTLGLTQPTVSKQLRVLRDAGLVEVQVDRQRRRYSLQPDALLEIDHWLSPFRRFWTERLDDLGTHLDATYPQEST